MTWLSDTEYLCYQCSFCRNRNSVLSSFITYHRVLTAVAQRVPLIEQELPTVWSTRVPLRFPVRFVLLSHLYSV